MCRIRLGEGKEEGKGLKSILLKTEKFSKLLANFFNIFHISLKFVHTRGVQKVSFSILLKINGAIKRHET